MIAMESLNRATSLCIAGNAGVEARWHSKGTTVAAGAVGDNGDDDDADTLVLRNYAGFYCYIQGILHKPCRSLTYRMADTISDGKPLRIILWAPPRSLSTAFERCIASSDDNVRIYHEMFTAAYHLGPERQTAIPVPWASKVIAEKQFTYDWVKQELEGCQEGDSTKVVFCKELGYTMQGHFRSLPSGYQHTFLIRHPAKVFLSMNKLINKYISKHVLKLNIIDLLPKGLIFKELFELFFYVSNTLGQKVIIIDADDLVEQPEMTLRAYCNAVGLPYSSSMIHWKPLDKEQHRWSFSKRLMFVNKLVGQYDRAFSTSGLEKVVEKPMDLTTVTPEVLLATEASVEYYEKLYKLRLQPLASSHSPGSCKKRIPDVAMETQNVSSGNRDTRSKTCNEVNDESFQNTINPFFDSCKKSIPDVMMNTQNASVDKQDYLSKTCNDVNDDGFQNTLNPSIGSSCKKAIPYV